MRITGQHVRLAAYARCELALALSTLSSRSISHLRYGPLYSKLNMVAATIERTKPMANGDTTEG